MPRVKHTHDEWQVIHVTTRTLDQKFYLASAAEKQRILDAISFYHSAGRYRLLAYVVMGNHVHMVICPVPPQTVSRIMRDWKAWTSRHNVSKPAGEPLWERRFDDNRIHSTRELTEVVQYIHDNPVLAGIVKGRSEYPWSSVLNYYHDGKELIPVDVGFWEPSP